MGDPRNLCLVGALALALLTPGCRCNRDDGESGEMWYRVVATVEDSVEVPFFLGFLEDPERAVIRNGEQDLELEVVQRRDPIIVRVPVLGVRLRLEKEDGDTYTGKWLPSYVLGRDFELRAERVPRATPEQRFPGEGEPTADLSGKWRVQIHDFGVGRAVFRQEDSGDLSGSLIPPDIGDTRHLSGRVFGDRFALSGFDGIHAFVIRGDILDDGQRLEGRWVVGGFGSWRFSATRGNEPSVASLVSAHLEPGASRVSLPELDKPEYRGEPVLVDFFGTWCPACMDLTPVIVRLHEEYRDQGLKILSIALEPPGDKQAARRRLREFKEKYGVTWDIEVRYAEDFTDQIPPEIVNADGFPLTIFVRRDGTVAGVHTAFVSDAARPEHQEVIEQFEAWTREIVSSPAPVSRDAGSNSAETQPDAGDGGAAP